MKVISPHKMTVGEGLGLDHMIQDCVYELNLCNGIPLDQVYHVILREQFGVQATVLRSHQGWWCGVVKPSDQQLERVHKGTAAFAKNLLTKLEDFENLSATARKEILGGFKLSLDSFARSVPSEYLDIYSENAVFGVSFHDVITAIIGIQLDPEADLFLSSGEFSKYYTQKDWSHICMAFGALLPFEATHDPNQMLLFKEMNSLRGQSMLAKNALVCIEHMIDSGPDEWLG